MKSEHRWRFFRAGGFDQVKLDSGEDLVQLGRGELDQKLWVALSCPVKGLEFDSKTLEALDTDKDGRIRVPEILAATKWATTVLKDPAALIAGPAALPLSAINDKDDEGKQLLSAAKSILTNLGKGDAKSISVDDTADTAKIFAQTRFNGDGIVPVDSARDEATQKAIADILSVLGAATDRSGKPGIETARVEQFWKDGADYVAWAKQAEDDPSLLAFGANTTEAMELIRALEPEIEDYFTRCRLAAFDPRAAESLNRSAEDFAAMSKGKLSLTSNEVTSLPLARIEAGKPLPLTKAINPAFVDALAKLKRLVVVPLFGERDALTDAEWQTIGGRFAAWQAWQKNKAGASVEPLGLPRVKELVAGGQRAAIEALIVEDKALEKEASSIDAVDRLIRYHRDLYRLLNNYISFRDFYTRTGKAIFQAGTLYFDQRSCEMCMRVEDANRHATFANLSRSYLLYCDVTRKATGESMQIVAAITDGDAGDLAVGRNGIFYDREGLDWDATVSKLVENPISIRQAFWAPYKKVAAMVEEQIGKFAASRDKEVSDTAAAKTDAAAKTAVTGNVPLPTPTKDEPPFDVAKFAGVFAAIGLAIGAIGGVLASVFGGFAKLPFWQVPIALSGLMLLISGPSMLLAWMKLRQRNLGPLLDANGWAINTKARINIPFGRSLTSLAQLPPGSSRDLRDPFEEKHPWRARFVLLAILSGILWASWYYGPISLYLPFLPKSSHIEKREAEKKAADDKAAAEKKAADEKAAAEKKAADEKAAAAKKAADDKAAAEKKTADEKAAAGAP